MPTSNNTFVAGTVVSDAEIKTRLQNFEEWVNGGILATDTQGSAWVKSQHIYGPDFYGAPTPRAVLTTGDTHWRLSPQDPTRAAVLHEEMVGTIETGDGFNWIPVEGLNLAGVETGEWQVVCLPIKIEGCDGAPCRTILMEL